MKTVIAGALVECVHVVGAGNFFRLADSAGWRTVFLGPAVYIDQVFEIATLENADLVEVSYRLTSETDRCPLIEGERLAFSESKEEIL